MLTDLERQLSTVRQPFWSPADILFASHRGTSTIDSSPADASCAWRRPTPADT